jgi:uncharacterized protein YjiS (DUF1127 family)
MTFSPVKSVGFGCKYVMNTAHGVTWLEQTPASTRRVSSLLRRYRGGFQERRKRQRLQATLCDLNDRELQDIGITRGEIDYVASEPLYRPARHLLHPTDECLISGTDG